MTSTARLSKWQRWQLDRALRKAGYFIWAGLIDRGYPHDPEEVDRAHHLWNTMPKKPWRWKAV